MVTANRAQPYVGRRAIWRPHRSDETGIEVRINDAVWSAASSLLMLVSPVGGIGATWVLAREVWCDGKQVGT